MALLVRSGDVRGTPFAVVVDEIRLVDACPLPVFTRGKCRFALIHPGSGGRPRHPHTWVAVCRRFLSASRVGARSVGESGAPLGNDALYRSVAPYPVAWPARYIHRVPSRSTTVTSSSSAPLATFAGSCGSKIFHWCFSSAWLMDVRDCRTSVLTSAEVRKAARTGRGSRRPSHRARRGLWLWRLLEAGPRW